MALSISVSSFAAEIPSIKAWIVGKQYVAFWNGAALELNQEIAPASHSFDASACRLWVSDDKKLERFDEGKIKPALSRTETGRLLAPRTTKEIFFLAGNEIQRKNELGETTSNFTLPDPAKLQSLHFGQSKIWALYFDSQQHHIALRHFKDGEAASEPISVATATVIWANPRLLVHPVTDDVWVGYSSSAPGHAYSPFVNQYGANGKLKHEYRWALRGLFFDFCPEGDTVLSAHDLPTMPFTVPVTSYVEKLVPKQKPAPVYEAATNDFVDSLTSRADGLWMIQRSIFGSNGSYLVHAKVGEAGPGTVFQKLPSPAENLYVCE